MSAEINTRAFLDSDYYQKGPDHAAWVESRADTIIKEHLWKPVVVHVTNSFLCYVHEQTEGREVAPYKGILNPCDESGDFVLFPWFSMEDIGELVRSSLTKSANIDESLSSLMIGADPVKFIKHFDRKLIIPRSELYSIAWDPKDKYREE